MKFQLPFKKHLAGASQIKHILEIFITWLFTNKPVRSKSFNSSTNGDKNSSKFFGFPTPHHIEITNGFSSGISEYKNQFEASG